MQLKNACENVSKRSWRALVKTPENAVEERLWKRQKLQLKSACENTRKRSWRMLVKMPENAVEECLWERQ